MGKLDTEFQLAYIDNVIDKCTILIDPYETMLAKDTAVFLLIRSIIRNAMEKKRSGSSDIQPDYRNTESRSKKILGKVSEREKVFMNAVLLMVSVYYQKATEFVSVMSVIQDLMKLHTAPFKNVTSYYQIKKTWNNLHKTHVKR